MELVKAESQGKVHMKTKCGKWNDEKFAASNVRKLWSQKYNRFKDKKNV